MRPLRVSGSGQTTAAFTFIRARSTGSRISRTGKRWTATGQTAGKPSRNSKRYAAFKWLIKASFENPNRRTISWKMTSDNL